MYQLLRSQNGTLRLELVPTKGEGRKRHEEDPLRRANRERWEKKNEMGNVELWHRLILQRQQQRGGIRPRAGSAFEANGQMEQKENGKNGGIAKQKYSEIWPKHRSASPGRKGGETKRGLKRGNPKWGYNPPKPQSTQFIHSILPNPFLRRSFSYSFHWPSKYPLLLVNFLLPAGLLLLADLIDDLGGSSRNEGRIVLQMDIPAGK